LSPPEAVQAVAALAIALPPGGDQPRDLRLETVSATSGWVGGGVARPDDPACAPYLAPEVLGAAGRVPDVRRAEVWSLGVLLYELLADRCPFEGRGREALMRAQEGLPTPLQRVCPAADPELVRIVYRALAREAAHRQADPAAFAADLRAWEELRGRGRSLSARLRNPGRRTLPVAALLLCGAAVVGGGAAWVGTRPSGTARREAETLVKETRALLPPDLLGYRDPLPEGALGSARGRLAALRAGAGGDPQPELRALLDEAQRALDRAGLEEALAAGDADAAGARWAELRRGLSASHATILEARVAEVRGEAVRPGSLRSFVDHEDRAVSEAARVVLARTIAAHDPAQARELMRGVRQGTAPGDMARVELLAAADALDARLIRNELGRGLVAPSSIQEARRHALACALEVASARPADWGRVRSALSVLEALGPGAAEGAEQDAPFVDAVLVLLRERWTHVDPDERSQARARRYEQIVDVLERLVTSGVRRGSRWEAWALLDATGTYLAESELQGLHVRLRVALMRLDVDMAIEHLPKSVADGLYAGSPEAQILRLLSMMLHTRSEELPARHKELYDLLEENDQLRPCVRASCLAIAVDGHLVSRRRGLELLEGAVEMDPDSPLVRVFYAGWLRVNGRQRECLEQTRVAMDLDRRFYRERRLLFTSKLIAQQVVGLRLSVVRERATEGARGPGQ
jgi:hypothetical protein